MFKTLLGYVLELIESTGVSAISSFPERKLDRASETVSVALGGMTLYPTAVGACFGTEVVSGEEYELYGCRAEAEISMSIYVPFSLGSMRCLEIAEKLRAVFEGNEPTLKLDGFNCGEVTFDRDSGMLCCLCTVKVEAYPMKRVKRSSGTFTDYVLKGAVK